MRGPSRITQEEDATSPAALSTSACDDLGPQLPADPAGCAAWNPSASMASIAVEEGGALREFQGRAPRLT